MKSPKEKASDRFEKLLYKYIESYSGKTNKKAHLEATYVALCIFNKEAIDIALKEQAKEIFDFIGEQGVMPHTKLKQLSRFNVWKKKFIGGK